METTVAKRISPMLAARDMDLTLAFYRKALGFVPTLETAEYAIVERDGQTMHFMKAASEEVMSCARGHTEIYIEASAITALWKHVRNLEGALPGAGFVRANLQDDGISY